VKPSSAILLSLTAAAWLMACTAGRAAPASPSAAVPSPAPSPTFAVQSAEPTVDPARQAGRDYLAALAGYLAAIEEVTDACAGHALGALQRCFNDSARALGSFRSRVAAIRFPDDHRPLVERMVAQADELHALLSSAGREPSLERIQSHWWPLIDEIDVAVLEAAQDIRKAMGLPAISGD
jgi:hypothetical protein